jgi:hypothetical protein
MAWRLRCFAVYICHESCGIFLKIHRKVDILSQVKSTFNGTKTLESRLRGIDASLLLEALLSAEAADSGLEAGYIRIDFFDLSPGIIDKRMSWCIALSLSDTPELEASIVAF